MQHMCESVFVSGSWHENPSVCMTGGMIGYAPTSSVISDAQAHSEQLSETKYCASAGMKCGRAAAGSGSPDTAGDQA